MPETLHPTDDAAICTLARERFHAVQASEARQRERERREQHFASGRQWEDALQGQRRQDNRPCLTMNRIPQFLHQVTNEQVLAPLAMRAQPVDDRADLETAKIVLGMFRNIEQTSNAEVAYRTAYEAAVGHGVGYFRVVTEYESPHSFKQVLKIRRIRNRFCCYLDPAHQELDGSDANWGFVVERLSRHAYQERYGPAPGIRGLGSAVTASTTADIWVGTGDTWITPEEVQVAEYFYREWVRDDLCLLADDSVRLGRDVRRDDLVIERRPTQIPVVWWTKINGYQILERTRWLGTSIPIIPVYGEERDLDGEVERVGMVHGMMDPQMLFNYMRPLSLDTPLPTPSGWTTMGEVEPGDWLFNEQGQPCRVLGLSPIYTQHACFKVTFDDGTSIIADGDHRWPVERKAPTQRDGQYVIWKTESVPTRLLMKHRYYLWNTRPLDLPEEDLPIDPYVLGVWLGDGSQAEPRITSGERDVKEMRALLEDCGMTLSRGYQQSGALTFTLLGVRRQFTRLGLLGHKHIPPVYLRASAAQRLALLQGIMDTDGTVGPEGQCSLTTTIAALRDGFTELLHSLGLKVRVVHQERPVHLFPNGQMYRQSEAWVFSFSPPEGVDSFRFERKLLAQRRRERFHPRRTNRREIVRVERVDAVPVRCLAIDSPSHLFLAGSGMVPTHNSAEAEAIGLAPRAPFVIAEGQLEGYETYWQQANNRNFPYLPYKPITSGGVAVPPPQRLAVEPAVQAITQAGLMAVEDMKAAVGIYDASLGQRGNETASVAIRDRERQGSLATAHYPANLRVSIRRAGMLCLELFPKIYDQAQIIRIIGEDGQSEQVGINQVWTDKTGVERRYNVTTGLYDLVVSSGPTYATQRQEAAEKVSGLVSAYPPVMALAGDYLVQNMDMPHSQEIAARMKTQVPPEALAATEGGRPEDQVASLQAQLQQASTQLQALEQVADQQQQQVQMAVTEVQRLTLQLANKENELRLKGRELDLHQQEIELKREQMVLDHEIDAAKVGIQAHASVRDNGAEEVLST